MSDKASKVVADAVRDHLGFHDCPTDENDCCADTILAALKAAGIALVELPQPDTTLAGWEVLYGDDPEEVYVAKGKVHISGVDSFSPDNARQVAATLLAAADAAKVCDE